MRDFVSNCGAADCVPGVLGVLGVLGEQQWDPVELVVFVSLGLVLELVPVVRDKK